MKSIYALILVIIAWTFLGSVYYPKWKKTSSEATISWDVSGYYHYLPAIFIYKDLRHQNWMNEINQKYLPSPVYDQSYVHAPTGHKINKYPIGQAIMFTPFFLAGHTYAKATGQYPADGYSRPYQVAIWLGGLLVSILGLILLRLLLKAYFNDNLVGWTLLALGIGSHWMEYAAITNGMTHTWLFTLLCVLIISTIRFYQKQDWISITGIGVSVGLAVLTRPTEIVWVMIPLLWGITSLKDRFTFIRQQWQACLAPALIAVIIICIQPMYWKYVSGSWFQYSYGEQSFQWLHPNIWRGLMGVNVGWFMYTPIMLIAMAGWYRLYKSLPSLFWPTFVTAILAIYITLSWPHWETGGGLGQRNLIQAYPLFAFPLIAILSWFNKDRLRSMCWWLILALNMYYTGWWIHQAHKGGFFLPGQMKTKYFYSVAGRFHPDRENMKLLDTDELFKGSPGALAVIFTEDFEKDSFPCVVIGVDSTKAACLTGSDQFIGPFVLPVSDECSEWIRCEGDFNIQSREYNVWKLAQWSVIFYQSDQIVKSNMIRIQRLVLQDQQNVHLQFDVRVPEGSFDKCTMTLWNADSANTLLVDDLKVSCFR